MRFLIKISGASKNNLEAVHTGGGTGCLPGREVFYPAFIWDNVQTRQIQNVLSPLLKLAGFELNII